MTRQERDVEEAIMLRTDPGLCEIMGWPKGAIDAATIMVVLRCHIDREYWEVDESMKNLRIGELILALAFLIAEGRVQDSGGYYAMA